MKKLPICAAISLALASAEVQSGSGLYVCTIEEALAWESGRLAPGLLTEYYVNQPPRTIRFDAVSGVLRVKNQEPVRYDVVSPESSVNNLIAKRELQGPARYVVNTFRIQTWQEPLAFIYMDGTVVVTGLCEEE